MTRRRRGDVPAWRDGGVIIIALAASNSAAAMSV
jgi:hypothetical protein